MKVVLTTTALPLLATDQDYFAGLEVDLSQVDGTNRAALLAATTDADVVMAVHEPIDREVVANLTNCRAIVRVGIGVDNIDVEAATEAGIPVTNVPDANYREVAVHAVAMALALTRRLPAYDKAMRADGWAGLAVGGGMRRPDNQVFGLLGMGRIGGRVAAMAQAIGYTVQVYDPYLDPAQAEQAGVTMANLAQVLETSDVISLHIPLTPETKGLIGAPELARMKKSAVLVNVSRGGLVDEGALAAALDAGQLAGAGIDVWESEPPGMDNPLLKCEAALLSPHAAYFSVDSFAEIRRKGFEDAARALRGEPLKYPVN
jgi:D-3-phosphoglycerate dehydrogenase